jgi:hypothetical protein
MVQQASLFGKHAGQYQARTAYVVTGATAAGYKGRLQMPTYSCPYEGQSLLGTVVQRQDR